MRGRRVVNAEDIAAGAFIALILAGVVGCGIAIAHFVATNDLVVSAGAGLKAELASDAAAEAAGGHERAMRAAAMYERAGDAWTAAVAHGMAAEAAADAGRWTEAAVWSDNAARALAMSEALYVDAGTARERQRVAEAIDGLAGE